MYKPKPTQSYLLVICAIVTSFAISRPSFADEFDEALAPAQSFIGQYETIRSLSRSELQALVKAICEGDDAQFESVSSAAVSRLQGNVGNMHMCPLKAV